MKKQRMSTEREIKKLVNELRRKEIFNRTIKRN